MAFRTALVWAATACLFVAQAAIRFEDVSGKAGLSFRLRNGAEGKFHQIELMAGGVAAFDYDGDGCTDLFFANGAPIPSLHKSGPEFWNRLYRNDGAFHFTDVTESSGLAGEGFAFGAAVADFDRDGNLDLFVPALPVSRLYRNGGAGIFEDVTVRVSCARAPRRVMQLCSASMTTPTPRGESCSSS